MDKLRILSLFSGIGAFEKALRNLGIDYEVVGYCEFDKDAAKAYSLIHGIPETMNYGDVTKVDAKELPEFDIMTYGFPCQPFSYSGDKLGFADVDKGNLFFESMRIAKEKQPKYMVAENVKGLVGHDKGRTFETVLKTLESIGYNNYYKVLNSVNFGIPQSRERVFIVSIRKDIEQTFEFPVGAMTTKTVADFIDTNETHRHIKESLRPYLDTKYHKEYQSNNGLKKVFDGNAQGYFKSDFTGKRMYSIHGISPTLTTSGSTHTFVEIGGHINAKERLMLQGFTSDDYNAIKGHISEAQIIKQAGNSIVVNVLMEIFKELLCPKLPQFDTEVV